MGTGRQVTHLAVWLPHAQLTRGSNLRRLLTWPAGRLLGYADTFMDVTSHVLHRNRPCAPAHLPTPMLMSASLSTTPAQGLVDAAQQQLASNYARLRAVCEAAGAQHADDSVYGSFQEAVGEWNRKLQHGHAAAAGGALRLLQAERRKRADVTADTRTHDRHPPLQVAHGFAPRPPRRRAAVSAGPQRGPGWGGHGGAHVGAAAW